MILPRSGRYRKRTVVFTATYHYATGCDTSIPLWRRGRSLQGCCEWVGMPIVVRRRFLNIANQRLRTLATTKLNEYRLEAG